MAGQVRLRDQFAALERAMRDWELVDSDRFSFEDSDRFEEDSLCSWISEPESLCNNWRGWKKSNFPPNGNPVQNNISGSSGKDGGGGGPGSGSCGGLNIGGGGNNSNSTLKKLGDYPAALNGHGLCSSSSNSSTPLQLNLVELSAKTVASHIPFEMVERFYPPVPEQLQLRIAFWSFPEHEEDIRLYSCLANGSAEEFQKGERLFRNDSVSDILQIGFHLSATVKPNMREAHKVAVTFDRRRVTSCTCTCNASTNWCGHVVAVCLHRIFQSKDVMLRAPVSESLSRLHRDQLQKFAQYLISELPQQILPTAQRLLDELLSSQRSAINTLRGAPDPTAGASANEQTSWFLDERTLHGNIHKILIKFCVPAPIVFSDVNYLSSAAPPASAEWSSLLRPLRGREPEGMWNLLSIVREMFRREDRNAVPLLEIITEECLNCDQILVWWFNTKVALHNGNSGHGGKHHSVNSNAHACQHAGSSLCDEIVLLWRLAALNPGLSPDERCILHNQFKEWHMKIIEKVAKSRNASVGSKHVNSFKNDVDVFPGFRPSIEACYLNWENYPIPGITYLDSNLVYHCPFMCFRHSDGHSRSGETGMIHSSHAILNNPAGEHHLLHSSATISSVPLSSSKRPRSVDFGAGAAAVAAADKNYSNSNSLAIGTSGSIVNPSIRGPSSSSGHSQAIAGPSGVCSALNLGSSSNSSQQPGPSSSSSIIKSAGGGKSGKGGKKLQQQQHREALAAAANLTIMETFSPILPVGASGLKIKTSRQPSLEQSSGTSFEDEAIVPGIPGHAATGHGTNGMSTSSSSSTSTHSSNPIPLTHNKTQKASPATKPRETVVPVVPVIVPIAPPVQLPLARENDGNRSSVSSEGFCENEVEAEAEVEGDADVDPEVDSENLKDEGVEILEPVASRGTKSSPLPLNLPLSLPSLTSMSRNVSVNANANATSDELEIEADVDPIDLDDSDSSVSARVCGVIVPNLVTAKFDSSDSQSQQSQSGDEYQLYYYDPKTPIAPGKPDNSNEDGKKDPLGLNAFSNLKRIEDVWEVLFARAEGLHAHGHSKDACVLGVKLAEELLANPPDLTLDTPTVPTGKGKKRKVNPASHQVSCLASATLAKCGFLCTVLAENPDYFYLAFQVGMFGLELCRPPASTKPLEVKLANQEAELAQLLKRIFIGQKELDMIRGKAESLRDGQFKSRGDALLPLVLSNFIFDALVMPSNREGRCSLQQGIYHLPTDESLGFEAAVAALGLKANVSEAEHPLLCEGTRRQRGDLALSMLLHYKDDPDKLAKVMDKLLDREIHQLYKAPLPSAYYSNNPPTTTLLGSNWANKNEDFSSNSTSSSATAAATSHGHGHNSHGHGPSIGSSLRSSSHAHNHGHGNHGHVHVQSLALGSSPESSPPPLSSSLNPHRPGVNVLNVVSVVSEPPSPSSSSAVNGVSHDHHGVHSSHSSGSSSSSGLEVESLASLLRATSVGGQSNLNNLNNNNSCSSSSNNSSESNKNLSSSSASSKSDSTASTSPGGGGSSSPAASASPPAVGIVVVGTGNGVQSVDNGPNGNAVLSAGAVNGSNATAASITAGNGSSGNSPSSGSNAGNTNGSNNSNGNSGGNGGNSGSGNGNGNGSGTTTVTTGTTTTTTTTTKSGRESGRFKGKRNYPVLPNQPSEAGAHFMFELAKIVLGKAGGSSNQSLFTQPSTGQNPRGPHRALHMCAFHIGLYALGLHNAVSPNWLSRTYSSHVSWITGQAMEIGAPAIAFLIDTWDSHLTPPEAVTIADRASRGDVNMVRAAAELALSCLPFAHALNPNEIHRAILQCKEQSDGMLEKACITVENAAKGGGVYPEVLFDVARQWYSLYQKHLPLDVDLLNDELSHHDSLLSGLDSNGLDSLNGSHVSAQTGLPPVNPNNLPPPPPSVSQAGPGGPGGALNPLNPLNPSSMSQQPTPMEIMGMAPPGSGPPISHPHQQGVVYPMGNPQVPIVGGSIPYATSPYGQVPFLPATFNPVPGNFVYGQAVIYQASTNPNPNQPGVTTTTSGYYNQQTAGQGGQASLAGVGVAGSYGGAPGGIHQHQPQLHNMVSAGPALQYYPTVTPISSAGPTGHLRPTAQFFPVSHMSLHPAHGSLQSMPPPTGSNVAAAMAAAAAAGHSVHSHGHSLTNHMTNQGHLVAIPPGNQSNAGQQMAMAANMAAAAAAANGHSHNPHAAAAAAAAVAAHAHNISMANGGRPPGGQPQVMIVNCGNSLISHAGSSFVQGGPLTSTSQGQAMPGQHGSGMNSMVIPDCPPTSQSQSQQQQAQQQQQQHQQQQLVRVGSAGFFPHMGGIRDPLGVVGQGGGQASAVKVKYLLASYRVGMLAMETLARRVHDDRPAAKFARNPPYGEDVKWLLGISRKLGAQYLQQFCICAVSSIANPFVLHEIILDAALISTRNNLAWVYQNPRSPLSPLVQKCQQMYFQCLHQKLYHITLSDYEDFVNIVCTARQAFHLTPDGVSQFKEWLQNLRRSKACKKDLWAQITAALQANPK